MNIVSGSIYTGAHYGALVRSVNCDGYVDCRSRRLQSHAQGRDRRR